MQIQNTNRKALGFTLVELMVSIFLGVIITAAVVQTYLSTKQTYRVTDGVGRVQENARFAHYFITKDLREAGDPSCLATIRNKLNGTPDAHLPSDAPIFAWNYNTTVSGANAFQLADPNQDAAIADPGNWDTAPPAFLNGNMVVGSDVLWFKSLVKLDLRLANNNTVLANQLNLIGGGGQNVANNSILMVGNCFQSEIFQVTGSTANILNVAVGAGGSPGNRVPAGDAWGQIYDASSDLYQVLKTYYYIGRGASGLPSLYRFQTALSPDSVNNAIFNANTQEVVEGVESLQVLLGEDPTAAGDDPDGRANRYVSANQVGDWDDVVSARLGLLIRSPNAASDVDQAATYTLLDNIAFTHAADDRILRYTVNSTVKPRNRGLQADLTTFVCDAGAC